VQIQVKLEGDLLGAVSGAGTVELQDIRLGAPAICNFP
jgi:hypothetical protein